MSEKYYKNLITDYQFCSNAVKKAEIRVKMAQVILAGLKKGYKWAINANNRDWYPSRLTKL